MMVIATSDSQFYRPAVGLAVFNPEGKIWLGHRKGQLNEHAWQLPQGGIDPYEPAEKAAYRELYEETGMQEKDLVLLGRIEDELYYDFPPEFRRRNGTQIYRGQRQSWFAMQFLGQASDIDLKAHPPQEFSDWRWGEISEIADLIIPFKRKVYERVAHDFAGYAKADK